MSNARELLTKIRSRLNSYHHADLLEMIDAELAKPEAEPVAWMLTGMVEHGTGKQSPMFFAEKPFVDGDNVIPLYISPRPMQRLTNEEILDAINKEAARYDEPAIHLDQIITQKEQEVMFALFHAIMNAMIEKNISPQVQPLTESEKSALADLYNSTSVSVAELIEAVEAKMVEKNR